jgi:acetylornithine deacetylase/succinyl-diaminopimelate desuccinylase-like protein
MLRKLREHLAGLGFTVLDHDPSDAERLRYPRIVTMSSDLSYGAFRSDFDAEPGRMARAGMRELFGAEPVLIRTMGGSIPIAPVVELLDIPAAIVPTVNIDNNQHSPNENLRLGNFIDGIAIITSVLSQQPAVADAQP